ncbi:MAG: threonylcarbamoyl-AMP synthase [Acidobacteria bacterium]|jgi:L-threonylcarbamoyladenylate synthase|nr:threonylcarbamoyl-AMP synthase [Acidobacteriota bacterium]
MTALPRRVTRREIVDPKTPDPATIAEAARVLLAGGLVVFPTETVYGLGAHALDAEAVAAIFDAKERPRTDPLIVHLASTSDLPRVAASVPAAAAALAAAFWPGPLTLIVPKHEDVPDIVSAGLPSVAVRVPAHPVAHALLAAAKVPVAAPSANRFSRPSPTLAAHVLADLDGRVDLVLDGGATDIGVESTIVDCTVEPPVVRRAGGVPIAALAEIVPAMGEAVGWADAGIAQLAPGQLQKHYAPTAKMTVFVGSADACVARVARQVRQLTAGGTRVGVLAPDGSLAALAPDLAARAAAGRVTVASLGPHDDPGAAARVLFASLRALDAAGVEVILALGPARDGLGAAVWDRLRRAADGRIITVPGD